MCVAFSTEAQVLLSTGASRLNWGEECLQPTAAEMAGMRRAKCATQCATSNHVSQVSDAWMRALLLPADQSGRQTTSRRTCDSAAAAKVGDGRESVLLRNSAVQSFRRWSMENAQSCCWGLARFCLLKLVREPT